MKLLTIGRGNFHGVAYSPDGRFLVSLNSRQWVRFWDLGGFAQRLAFSLARPNPYLGYSFSLHGTRVAVGEGLWDLTPAWDYLRQPPPGPGTKPARPPKPAFTAVPLEGATSWMTLAVSPDGQVLGGLTWQPGAPRDVRVLVWDAGGSCRKTFPTPALYPSTPALMPDGRTLAAPQAKAVLLLELSGGQEVGRLEHTDNPEHVLFSPDGRLLAVAAGRSVWLWDVAARKPLTRFRAFRQYAEALAFSPDGRLLAAGSGDGEVRLWETAGCKQVASLGWKVGAVHGLAFSPDGMTVAAAGHDNAVVVWDREEF